MEKRPEEKWAYELVVMEEKKKEERVERWVKKNEKIASSATNKKD